MAPTGGKGPFEEQGGGGRGRASIEGEFPTDYLNTFLGGRGGGSVRVCHLRSPVPRDEYAGPTLPGLFE